MPASRSLPLAAVALLAAAAPLAAQGYSPEEALRRMRVADGLEVSLVACEPLVRQPVTISFDTRGRLWVLQYLQYPNPAGLKPVRQDQFLRTVWDRVPEPPPRGPKGADRITILSDPDATGRYQKAKDFVTGLNLASGMALGHGGVFVAQPPYLLFYPDRNGDDVPDSAPEVLLEGFGMEDSHAYANSLQWGPDGWLYGAHGSTVTAKVRGIEFQQGIWRYHPVTKRFELFSEGGGNTWGLDFNARGEVIAGTNWGGYAMLHQVQGAYYVKGFGKHGPLHNPHTYGYFDHVPCPNFKGGHVTCGGVVYRGGLLLPEHENAYVAGNLLSNCLFWYTLERKGSSYVARQAGEFLAANDAWFRPIDCLVGPDGALYVVDWYDKRAAHLDPIDNWDRTNGRIYRVQRKGARAPWPAAIGRQSGPELVALLASPNPWLSGEARRLLRERRDTSAVPRLNQLFDGRTDRLALEAFWALYGILGRDEGLLARGLDHANEDVRAWAVRLLGDDKQVSATQHERLVSLARTDPSPTVRSQLACTAKRLHRAQGLPIVRELARRAEDVDDPFIPLLIWWAIEDKIVSHRFPVLRLFSDAEFWKAPIVRNHLIERVARRFLAEGGEKHETMCWALFGHAPTAVDKRLVLAGLEKALEGRRGVVLTPRLKDYLESIADAQADNPTYQRLMLRLGSAAALDRALRTVADPKARQGERVALLGVLGQIARPECVPVLLHLRDDPSEPVRAAALDAMRPFPDPAIATGVLDMYQKFSPTLRGKAQALLVGRPAWALALLRAVDEGRIPAKEVPLETVRQLAAHPGAEIERLLTKHWGRIGQETPGEKQARISWLKMVVGSGPGDAARGQPLYMQHCGNCHQLFDQGNKVGPPLDGVDRKNREFLLTHVVDPSAVIRQEFTAVRLSTADGRFLTGLIAEQTPQAVTLLDARNERLVVPRADVEELAASPISLMPEKILDGLPDQQIRDLFAYLQSDGKTPLAASRQAASGAAGGKVLRVCLVSGSGEYKSNDSLAAFQEYLEKNYPVKCRRAFWTAVDNLPGLEALDDCDVALFYTRRLTITGEQLERVKRYCQSGRPVVAVRTASHGFQKWLEMDREVLGGNYKGHYGAGPLTDLTLTPAGQKHPVFSGVKPFRSVGSLYKNPDLPASSEVLLKGTVPDHTEPVAWVRMNKGGRVFYTSLGHPQDFQEEDFRRMLANALYWAAQREMEK